MKNERFSSQLGFVLTAAGCAIGLGNIYRFPYLCGQYGGAIFVLIYICCLVLLAVPLVSMEVAVGRGSRHSPAKALQVLRPDKPVWRVAQIPQYLGNYIFQWFYTVITAQMLYFMGASLFGTLNGLNAAELQALSDNLNQNPVLLGGLTVVVILAGFGVCLGGLQGGVERAGKIMLSILFVMLIALAVYSVTLSGASEGLHFYLSPNIGNIEDSGVYETVSAAFGQVFFSVGAGTGSLCVFGKYMSSDYRVSGQAIKVISLDTFVALTAGLIVFPACFTYGIAPDSGPNLLVITMPSIFNQMPGGYFIGAVFFVVVMMASFSTITAAFENIVACTIDLTNWSRRKAVLANILPMILLSLPAVLGMNVWSGIQILGRSIMDAEDFLVSNNLLPLGALGYLLFCTRRSGWGWGRFVEEANTGRGMKFPSWLRFYCMYILPILLIVFWLTGLVA